MIMLFAIKDIFTLKKNNLYAFIYFLILLH